MAIWLWLESAQWAVTTRTLFIMWHHNRKTVQVHRINRQPPTTIHISALDIYIYSSHDIRFWLNARRKHIFKVSDNKFFNAIFHDTKVKGKAKKEIYERENIEEAPIHHLVLLIHTHKHILPNDYFGCAAPMWWCVLLVCAITFFVSPAKVEWRKKKA